MEQLILHLFGDYVTQSDWMAQNKRTNSLAAFAHALVYSAPFWLLVVQCHNPFIAWGVIFVTHFLIDRFGLARYLVWTKNWMAPWDSHIEVDGKKTWIPPTPAWRNCLSTGYPPDRPAWLAVWLMIAADNAIHLLINFSALKWL